MTCLLNSPFVYLTTNENIFTDFVRTQGKLLIGCWLRQSKPLEGIEIYQLED